MVQVRGASDITADSMLSLLCEVCAAWVASAVWDISGTLDVLRNMTALASLEMDSNAIEGMSVHTI